MVKMIKKKVATLSEQAQKELVKINNEFPGVQLGRALSHDLVNCNGTEVKKIVSTYDYYRINQIKLQKAADRAKRRAVVNLKKADDNLIGEMSTLPHAYFAKMRVLLDRAEADKKQTELLFED